MVTVVLPPLAASPQARMVGAAPARSIGTACSVAERPTSVGPVQSTVSSSSPVSEGASEVEPSRAEGPGEVGVVGVLGGSAGGVGGAVGVVVPPLLASGTSRRAKAKAVRYQP